MAPMPRSHDRRALLILVAVQLAVAVLVRPRGNFPLNDDWAYAHSVQWLLAEHRVRLSDWIAMNLLPQTLAGGAVAAMAGFSFEALRHVTQAVALLTSVAAFYWFRANRLEPGAALVATLVVIAFPAWPQLANSYMSDLYGLLFALAAATLFLRALDEPTRGRLILATLLAAAGVLQRQVVLVVPFAFMAAWLWTQRPWSVRVVAIALVPFLAAIGAEALYQLYLVRGPGLPDAQHYIHSRVPLLLGKTLTNEDGHTQWVASNVATIAGYLGLFLAPWLLWWGMGGASRAMRWTVAVGGAVLAVAAIASGWLPPYRPNQVIDAAGIGPFTIYDAVPRGLAGLDRSAGAFWTVAGAAAAFGIAALLALLVATLAHLLRAGRKAEAPRVFLAAIVVAYLGPFIVTDYIDRYMLVAMPFLAALWARTWTRRAAPLASGVALASIVAALALGAIATRDYFAWNRDRWDLIRNAESRGATPETLDGGFEYNGLMRHEVKPRGAAPGKSWWWVKDDEWVVAFTAVPGYEEVERRNVRHWLPRSPGEIRLLRRKP